MIFSEECKICTANCRYCDKSFVDRRRKESESYKIINDNIKLGFRLVVPVMVIWLSIVIIGMCIVSSFIKN